ncbi:anthranilate synthase / indole-3-glycerol phosphate synthase [Coemansia erecta]|uniref:N-(5'-phosphoribosyl)anthranilate isomerase n=1 Tax=Coemansia erecta TaxID=147472 RepID=A0A9W8CUF9_9FUNG|nr:anthranilate synthase / indole-3-glycerol phosphate synthase [Coemansia erecta]
MESLDNKVVVKICGVRTTDAAVAACEAGADIIGMIFTPSPRLIDVPAAQEIAQAVYASSPLASITSPLPQRPQFNADAPPEEYFNAWAEHITQIRRKGGRPLLTGVFQNQPLEHILEVARSVPLDMVQLHGTEPVEMAREIPVPVIKVFHVDDGFSLDGESDLLKTSHHAVILLDTKVAGTSQQGGRGVSFDWSIARALSDRGVPFLMAGGLTPENIGEAVGVGRPWGVDVSSGIETDKVKDPKKIRAFIHGAKDAR